MKRLESWDGSVTLSRNSAGAQQRGDTVSLEKGQCDQLVTAGGRALLQNKPAAPIRGNPDEGM